MRVCLQPVTAANWKECAALSVAPEQQSLVPANLYSIAEAQFYSDAYSRAIYTESGQLVGYALYGRDVDSGCWKIFRLMIDVQHQRKGYGTAALRELLLEIAAQPDSGDILICYQDANQAARKLYATFEFVEQSIDQTGKVTAVLRRKEV
jgi:diamine N-acetyltransferase